MKKATDKLVENLTLEEMKSLIVNLSRKVLKIETNSTFYKITPNVVKCPLCGSYHIIKKGLLKGKQKY